MITGVQHRGRILPKIASVVNSHRDWQSSAEDSGKDLGWGGELVTTERTIKFHRTHIMQKMRAESIADLVRMAQKLGLTGQP
jgi:Bacterial regulatory proteins, luxR family